MRKIRILVVPSDRTGVSYYRSTKPHIYLEKNYTEELNGNQAFGVGRDDSLLKKNGIDIKQISLNKIWKSSPESIKKYYRQTGAKVLIDYDKLISDINNVRRDYTEQRNELEKNLQEEMNKIVENEKKIEKEMYSAVDKVVLKESFFEVNLDLFVQYNVEPQNSKENE